MNRVFDASALVAFLRKEAGGQEVADILSDRENDCFCHYLNAVEAYSRILRSHGEEAAETAMLILYELGVEIRPDNDEAITKQAANWSSLFQMSLADGFGLALSQRLSADFISNDRHELEIIQRQGLHTITLVRTSAAVRTEEYKITQRAEDAINRLKQLEESGDTVEDWRARLKGALDQ
jgi:predicted nucleic acid-binding protein